MSQELLDAAIQGQELTTLASVSYVNRQAKKQGMMVRLAGVLTGGQQSLTSRRSCQMQIVMGLQSIFKFIIQKISGILLHSRLKLNQTIQNAWKDRLKKELTSQILKLTMSLIPRVSFISHLLEGLSQPEKSETLGYDYYLPYIELSSILIFQELILGSTSVKVLIPLKYQNRYLIISSRCC